MAIETCPRVVGRDVATARDSPKNEIWGLRIWPQPPSLPMSVHPLRTT